MVPGKDSSMAFLNLSCRFTRSRVPDTRVLAFGFFRKSKTFNKFLLQGHINIYYVTKIKSKIDIIKKQHTFFFLKKFLNLILAY
ncbi:hypothetical protein Hanom_Chr13g01227841 [Helianthus anomalus]